MRCFKKSEYLLRSGSYWITSNRYELGLFGVGLCCSFVYDFEQK